LSFNPEEKDKLVTNVLSEKKNTGRAKKAVQNHHHLVPVVIKDHESCNS